MKRGFPRAGPPSIGRTALAVVLLLWPGLLAAPVSAQSGGGGREPFCYSWEFTNSTAQEPDDLHASLRGIRHVTSAYQGDDNVFDLPQASSGYDAAADAYDLEYLGGPAPDATLNHLGVCADSATLRLTDPRQGQAFYWTLGGKPLEPAPVFLGVSWARLGGNGLRITLYNDQDAALTLWSAALLASDQPLPLNDMGGDVVATLPAVMELAPAVLTLDAGTQTSFVVPREAYTGLDTALVLALAFSNAADEGDAGRLYAQLLPPLQTYLPLILR